MYKRQYLTWRYGPLRRADMELLKRAGIPTDGRVVMQFLPPEVENRLANLEQQYCDAQGRTLKQVRTTVFGVRGTGGQYEFFEKSQETR